MHLFSCFHRSSGADERFGVFAVEIEEELQPIQFRLDTTSSGYTPIVLTEAQGDDLKVISELVAVVG
jgi:hypothetical protein